MVGEWDLTVAPALALTAAPREDELTALRRLAATAA
jgi:hypothetical protein